MFVCLWSFTRNAFQISHKKCFQKVKPFPNSTLNLFFYWTFNANLKHLMPTQSETLTIYCINRQNHFKAIAFSMKTFILNKYSIFGILHNYWIWIDCCRLFIEMFISNPQKLNWPIHQNIESVFFPKISFKMNEFQY